MTDKYLQHVDVLRAIAVLSVVFYHFEYELFSGGYVGVDIFFVISGFLITGKLINDIRIAQFSFIAFYEKRARRLLPALSVVCILTVFLALWISPQHTFREAGSALLAQSIFSSNIYFWLNTNYFSPASDSILLLHTWSLSLEEQFYIVFPLLLFVLLKFNSIKPVFVLLLILAASLSLSITGFFEYPVASFYLLPTRLWEFMIGAIVAFLPVWKTSSARLEVCSWFGLVLLAIAIIGFDTSTPFPSWYALLPCLGTAFFIYFNLSRTLISQRLLAIPPVIFIGKISYSLYLYHWPIAVFAKTYYGEDYNGLVKLVCIALTFICSYLSWAYIENPIRYKTIFKDRTRFIVSSFLCLFFLASVGYLISNGMIKSRLPEQAQAFANAVDDYSTFDNVDTVIPESGKRLVLWGDSHAHILSSMLEKKAQEHGFQFTYFNSVAPIPGLFSEIAQPISEIDFRNEQITDKLLQARPEHLVIACRWHARLFGSFDKEDILNKYKNAYQLSEEQYLENAKQNFMNKADSLFQQFEEAGINVWLVKQAPEYPFNVPDRQSQNVLRAKDAEIGMTLGEYRMMHDKVNELIDDIDKRYGNIRTIALTDYICESGTSCKTVQDDRSLYRDGDHLSRYAVDEVAYLFNIIFDDGRTSSQSVN